MATKQYEDQRGGSRNVFSRIGERWRSSWFGKFTADEWGGFLMVAMIFACLLLVVFALLFRY
ncbi:MAG: hypothetical protein F4Y88_03510 [Chloroflexi bacterium]|nr:hypothetical protein [Chloroflexota bacterium]